MSGPARRWLVPEVVQTSAMDCGPAALKALLEGFGIGVSYGRLREACQTEVDGTSIDTLEEVACRIGLEAEQRIVSADDLLLPESESLPALLVVRQPSGLTHFVIAWRTHLLGGAFDERGMVQVMDPGEGRRWVSVEALRDELFIHEHPVPASAWREFAATERFVAPLLRRLRRLGVRSPDAWVEEALRDGSWRGVAALDAAVRLTTSLAKAGGVERGAQAEALAGSFYRAAAEAASAGGDVALNPVPSRFWPVLPDPRSDAADEERVLLRGAVVVAVKGVLAHSPVEALRAARGPGGAAASAAVAQLPPEIAAALLEEQTPPWRHFGRLLRADGLLSPSVIAAALLASALAALGESVIFRSLFEIARVLGEGPHRLGGIAAVLLFLAAVVALEFPLALALQRTGRHLENRLRVAFLEKLPRLGDRYFASRPIFDMTERSHSVQQLRALPPLAGQLLRSVAGLAVTTAGIALVAPGVALPAVAAALVSVALPLAVQRPLAELDLRFRSHAGALGRFYLDALIGLSAVRTHGAERTVRREHEALLVDWARAARTFVRASVTVEGVEALAGLALSASLLLGPFSDVARSGSVLLVAYWALSVPALGAEVAQLARQYPGHRNVALRLLEPLGALEQDGADAAGSALVAGPARVTFDDVTVHVGGHTVLDGVSVEIPGGSHVAVVGSSGAGKSSLVGTLLGWHRASSGRVLVDGEALDGPRLAALRRQTAWVDPAVQLWNRSLLDNLRYGTGYAAGVDLGGVVRLADLRGVLERLPEGMQGALGEGGALVSGGEGQRVRLARALLRPDARLVILDEPFRGLDRGKRRELLARARARWKDATLLCVTHDVRETRGFARVLVVEDGRVVEDGDPGLLAADASTRYRALLDAEDDVREGLWSAATWRRLRMEGGSLREGAPEAGDPDSGGGAGRP